MKQSWFRETINAVDKLLAIKEKEGTQLNKTTNERGDIKANTSESKGSQETDMNKCICHQIG